MSEQMQQFIVRFFNESGVRPLSVEELQDELNIETADDFKQLVIALNELEMSGELVRTRKDRFGLPEKMNLVRGTIQMHKKGFAFLIPDDEDQTDVYIHANDLASAMNLDKVLLRLEQMIGDECRTE